MCNHVRSRRQCESRKTLVIFQVLGDNFIVLLMNQRLGITFLLVQPHPRAIGFSKTFFFLIRNWFYTETFVK